MTVHIQHALVVPEGDGVEVKRLMPVANIRNFDPFVLWDHFNITAGGFPNHPHRGFEAITYMFEGGMHSTRTTSVTRARYMAVVHNDSRQVVALFTPRCPPDTQQGFSSGLTCRKA